jgi:hypothetical protein
MDIDVYNILTLRITVFVYSDVDKYIDGNHCLSTCDSELQLFHVKQF